MGGGAPLTIPGPVVRPPIASIIRATRYLFITAVFSVFAIRYALVAIESAHISIVAAARIPVVLGTILAPIPRSLPALPRDLCRRRVSVLAIRN